MDNNRLNNPVPTTVKVLVPQHNLSQQSIPDERYPGTFFRIPHVPVPGKTTWSLTK